MLLLIDNYDSFTYNLSHYCMELGAKVDVRRNDTLTAEACLALNPSAILLSPGPGRPEDAGICLELVKLATKQHIPLLGVCLGHQVIAEAFGGTIIQAPVPMHGKVSAVYHEGKSLFAGLPSPFQATRYHSLIVARESMPPALEITAETEGGIIMGLEHSEHRLYGMQFHPESIASEHGHTLLKHFLDRV